MKKNYLTPAMKVRKIQGSHILSGSNNKFGIYNQSAHSGQSAWSKEEDDLTEEDFGDILTGWE